MVLESKLFPTTLSNTQKIHLETKKGKVDFDVWVPVPSSDGWITVGQVFDSSDTFDGKIRKLR